MHWVLAEFIEPEMMKGAAAHLRDQRVGELDSYTPYPIHGLDEALGLKRSKVPLLALLGGLAGAATAYWMQWWMNAVDFPINVGGRPPHSAPSFVPITFELTVLFSAFAIFFGLFALARLPRVHHPVFEVEMFRSAGVDRFWLSVATETRAEPLQDELLRLGATNVHVVEGEP